MEWPAQSVQYEYPPDHHKNHLVFRDNTPAAPTNDPAHNVNLHNHYCRRHLAFRIAATISLQTARNRTTHNQSLQLTTNIQQDSLGIPKISRVKALIVTQSLKEKGGNP